LTPAGHELLEQSGLKSYIDCRQEPLVSRLPRNAPFDLYALQTASFRLVGRISFHQAFARRLNKFAFEHGVSTDLLRRIGAIYLRDIAAGRI
jgi:hypothetical protein